MNDQQRRLVTAAANAGYPGALLAAIAHATLPRYTAGERLEEQQLGQLADAIELLAEAGLSAEQTSELLDACRERAPERWRDRFWTVAVKAARANARHARANAGRNRSLEARR